MRTVYTKVYSNEIYNLYYKLDILFDNNESFKEWN